MISERKRADLAVTHCILLACDAQGGSIVNPRNVRNPDRMGTFASGKNMQALHSYVNSECRLSGAVGSGDDNGFSVGRLISPTP